MFLRKESASGHTNCLGKDMTQGMRGKRKNMENRNKISNLVLGAGIGGLAAGACLKENGLDFLIIDKERSLPANLNNGLHYLHSTNLEIPFNFKFKSVVKNEEVWDIFKNEFKTKATIPEMFEYSKKIMENLRHPSSIMDSGIVNTAFVPESNNINDLLIAYSDYIGGNNFLWKMDVATINTEKKVVLFKNNEKIEYNNLISTIPIGYFYKACNLRCPYNLKSKELFVTNYKLLNIVPNWLIVLYIFDAKFPVYRITSFNGMISMESMSELSYEDEVIIKYHIGDLFEYDIKSKTNFKWNVGRIFGIGVKERKEIIENFIDKNIYLVGRFALWNGKLRIDNTAIYAVNVVRSIAVNNPEKDLGLIELLSK